MIEEKLQQKEECDALESFAYKIMHFLKLKSDLNNDLKIFPHPEKNPIFLRYVPDAKKSSFLHNSPKNPL